MQEKMFVKMEQVSYFRQTVWRDQHKAINADLMYAVNSL